MLEESLDYYSKNKFFSGKNVIVTGATGGIGSHVVRDLYLLGAKIACIVRDTDKYEMIFTDLIKDKNSKNNLRPFIIDFAESKFISEKFTEIMTFLEGKLDIVFMCHGVFDSSDFLDTTQKQYDTLFNVNTRSSILLLSISSPFLKVTKGNVVIVSSLESFIPYRGSFLNSITKSMNNMLIQSSALELAPFKVRVNGVAPGVTNTEHRVGVNKEFDKEANQIFIEDRAKHNLLGGKPIEPVDVVNAMLFLASDEAGFITGEIIKVDAGYSLNHDLNFTPEQEQI